MPTASTDHLVFEVRLEHVNPQPWRRFSLPSDSTFFDLHRAIQDGCGWTDGHLWLFHEADGQPVAGIPGDDPWGREPDPDDPDSKQVLLVDWFGRRRVCVYTYDFGDGWRHHVKLVERAPQQDGDGRRLLAGEWSFPPEDCGGVPGYQRCGEAARSGVDPWGEDEFIDWLAGWRPDFDLEAAQGRF